MKVPDVLSHPNQILRNRNPASPMKATSPLSAMTPEHKPVIGAVKAKDPLHQKDIERFAQLGVRTRNVRGPTETTHVTVKSRTLCGGSRQPEHSAVVALVPSPPSSAKPRPSSASKFRKMVLECRDGSA
jgi:hypothetical protein